VLSSFYSERFCKDKAFILICQIFIELFQNFFISSSVTDNYKSVN